jgi:hypothetical protein
VRKGLEAMELGQGKAFQSLGVREYVSNGSGRGFEQSNDRWEPLRSGHDHADCALTGILVIYGEPIGRKKCFSR